MDQTELCRATRDLREATYRVQNLTRSDLGVLEQVELGHLVDEAKELITKIHHLAHTGCKHKKETGEQQ